MPASRKQMITSAISNSQTALNKALTLREHRDHDVRELATAVHFLAFAVQEMGLALTDQGRLNDLPIK